MKCTIRLVVVWLGLLAGPLAAQTSLATFETVTFAASSIGFTAATLRPAGQPNVGTCSGKLETASIRIRYDGTAPTASVGSLVDVGDIITIRGLPHLGAFRGIRTGGSSGIVNFHCYR